jgi:hypothetical protein
MRFRLRDVFWLIFIIALGCLLWRERTRTQRLQMQARFYHSTAPLIRFVDEPIEKAIAVLEKEHRLKIEVDWPSVTKATDGLKPDHKTTQNLVDGSLVWALERIFLDKVVVEGTDRGILVRGHDPARDGPPKDTWEVRRKRMAEQKERP